MIDLIYDRTNTDIAKLKALRTKVKNRTATEAEFAEWLTSLKGAYNNTDLNRVGEAINYLSYVLNNYGYTNNASARTDWQKTEKPNPKQMQEYLDNLNKLKQAFPFASQANIPKDMVNLVISEANDIERFFYDQIEIILGMVQTFIVSGVSTLGQTRLYQQRFRRGCLWARLNLNLSQYNDEWNTVTAPSEEVKENIMVYELDNISTIINTWNNYMSELDKVVGTI